MGSDKQKRKINIIRDDGRDITHEYLDKILREMGIRFPENPTEQAETIKKLLDNAAATKASLAGLDSSAGLDDLQAFINSADIVKALYEGMQESSKKEIASRAIPLDEVRIELEVVRPTTIAIALPTIRDG